MEKVITYWKRFVDFLKKDTWASFIATLIIAFIFIKFILFPGLSFATGSSLPLVIVESCSMYHHEDGFDKILETSDIYLENGITINDTADWDFQNGFSKGDVMFIVGAKNIKEGDVIVFNAGTTHPLIHRVIRARETYSTKGDNYKTNSGQLQAETKIMNEQILGKALFKIPAIGWAKLILFEWNKSPNSRGLCK